MNILNILVLHSLGNPAIAPAFLSKHVFSLQRNFPEHNYIYHDVTLPIPSYVIEQNFDSIILDVSFLTCRWNPQELFESRKEAYSFVRDSSAIKLAFPQDEYDCSSLLDQWMCDWKIDVVFSVISSGWDVLYPKYHKTGKIQLGFTAYIDEELIEKKTKPFQKRTIDIGYRAKKLAPYFGRIGKTKWTIGRDVALLGIKANLKVDIKLGDEGTLYGDEWFNFIENSKFTLGSNSGSSLLDPYGAIQRCVKKYLTIDPEASFETVESICFPGLEGLYNFTAISPRILEASLLNSAQILVDGEYSGILKPYEHYIPIRSDASNFSEVLEIMSDSLSIEKMINRCRENILSIEALRYRNNSKLVLELIGDLVTQRGLSTNSDNVKKTISKYTAEMQPKYDKYWKFQIFRGRVSRAVSVYPMLHNSLRSLLRFLDKH